ncbi:probable transcription factor At5g61620 [Humulus lupulus]|uniref:probable transcription factor At5g61620 n=1 Tax=Humulus lupulus TaxID=3486 RepID=UPI002B415E0C|nr:probable transcription factor At5g61620 [Humulus lupulus]
MVRVDYVRKCSNCKQNGHNTRTCNKNVEQHNIDDENKFRLFGVDISLSDSDKGTGESMEKSLSLNNLAEAESSGADGSNDVVTVPPHDHDACFLSGDLLHSTRRKDAHERIRGTGKQWSEEEHRTFLMGLRELGRGDWRGISKDFVKSRSPSQVASHAQKYYTRQVLSEERKNRRRSVFDISLRTSSPARTSLFEKKPLDKVTSEFQNRFPSQCLDNYGTFSSHYRLLVPPRPLTNCGTAPSELYMYMANNNVAKDKSSFASNTGNTHSFGALPPKSLPKSSPKEPCVVASSSSSSSSSSSVDLKDGQPQHSNNFKDSNYLPLHVRLLLE